MNCVKKNMIMTRGSHCFTSAAIAASTRKDREIQLQFFPKKLEFRIELSNIM
ncbi:hypothetical protein A2U01_0044949, partial [Trifolium medium]|nr:hypothetical protein [Trifolium medium]